MNNENNSWEQHVLTNVSSLKNKQVVLRVDWNMPVTDGKITDTSRFDVTVPFLKELSFAGAKIIILTHFGEKGESLQVIASHVIKTFPFISFTQSLSFDDINESAQKLEPGNALLLENVRMWQGETDNLPSLARSFASLGSIFINDAFSVAHREHASVVGIAKLMLSYFGPNFIRELNGLTKILHPETPALLIVGGAKISTKLPLIQKYLDNGVSVFVGGAMVHNIWKAKGLEIGRSFFDTNYQVSKTFEHPLLMTPIDVVLEDGSTVLYNRIPKDGFVVDCGKETIENIKNIIESSKTVIVNGPLGLYEKGWLFGTEQVLLNLSESKTISYIGGGDTINVANSLHLLKKFTFVSLGGGAMLDFLASGTLPGIDAVIKQ